MFAVDEVNQSRWLWGVTRSFLRAVLAGEGFQVVWESELGPLANPRWGWWGCIAERQANAPPAGHWTRRPALHGVYQPDW